MKKENGLTPQSKVGRNPEGIEVVFIPASTNIKDYSSREALEGAAQLETAARRLSGPASSAMESRANVLLDQAVRAEGIEKRRGF